MNVPEGSLKAGWRHEDHVGDKLRGAGCEHGQGGRAEGEDPPTGVWQLAMPIIEGVEGAGTV